MNIQQSKYARFSPKWRERFEFFDLCDSLDKAGEKAAAQSLGFWKYLRVNVNFIAFFFGMIYFFVLGMWKRNLSMIGIAFLFCTAVILVAIIGGFQIPRGFDRGLACWMCLWYAWAANRAYYQKEVKGYNGWNPFK